MYDFRVGLVEFTRLHWLDMILDSRDESLRLHSLWMQVWRMQFRQEDHIFMIIVVQHQHGDCFQRTAWDPRILVGDILAVDMEARASFFLPEIGTLVDKFLDGWI
jgi:hypothetical protein